MVVVEVRQGTLGGDGRGWGPAGNTGRGWSWLRSDREHCASRVAVEQEEEEERRGGEEQATDIKSNNPHLAGGEKRNAWAFMTSVSWAFHSWFSSQIFTFLRNQTVTHSTSLPSTTHDVEKGWKQPACTLEVHWCSAQLPVQYHVRQACWWRQYH